MVTCEIIFHALYVIQKKLDMPKFSLIRIVQVSILIIAICCTSVASSIALPEAIAQLQQRINNFTTLTIEQDGPMGIETQYQFLEIFNQIDTINQYLLDNGQLPRGVRIPLLGIPTYTPRDHEPFPTLPLQAAIQLLNELLTPTIQALPTRHNLNNQTGFRNYIQNLNTIEQRALQHVRVLPEPAAIGDDTPRTRTPSPIEGTGLTVVAPTIQTQRPGSLRPPETNRQPPNQPPPLPTPAVAERPPQTPPQTPQPTPPQRTNAATQTIDNTATAQRAMQTEPPPTLTRDAATETPHAVVPTPTHERQAGWRQFYLENKFEGGWYPSNLFPRGPNIDGPEGS